MSVLVYSLYLRVANWKSPVSEWKHSGMHLYNTTVFINKQEHLPYLLHYGLQNL